MAFTRARSVLGRRRQGAVGQPSRPRPSLAPPDVVARAKEGDQDAFALLYVALFDGVSRYVASLVGDPHRAEDVVAQTFLLAWRGLPRLRRNERFEAWLFRIAHNQSMSELRRKRTVPIEAIADPVDPGRSGSPAAVSDAKADIALVRAALKRLPADQRTVLVLRFLRELPHADVARAMGRTEQATRALQYRALKRMLQVIHR